MKRAPRLRGDAESRRARLRALRPLVLPFPHSDFFAGGGIELEWTAETRGRASTLRIYQSGIFYNGLYHGIISMSKKYLAKYQKMTAKLRSARLEAGLTQVETGKKLKKPQAYLSKIERGERGVDAVELSELARVYAKDINYFIK